MSVTLPHNPRNAVTGTVERIDWDVAPGGTAVRKSLNGLNYPDTPKEWRASDVPGHFNYWRREHQVYASDLGEIIQGSGVRLPEVYAQEISDERANLVLEDVAGRTGHDLTFEDYGTIARAWATAQLAMLEADFFPYYRSRGFLRSYADSKPVDYRLLEEDSAWEVPLIKDNWPTELRAGLRYLYAQRADLFQATENQSRWPSHLDFWPNNVIVTEQNEVVPIDWAFFGEGAPAEDIGNFVPDAVFDGFVVSAHFDTLEALMFDAYADVVCQAGIATREELQLAFYASAVKYVWLGPLLLERAGETQQMGYGDIALDQSSAHDQYRERGTALLRLSEWARRAITLLS